MLSEITAQCHIKSIAPMCQSRFHGEPELENESKDAYNIRTWRLHMHVANGTVQIPARALHDSLVDAAKYSKRQIPGQGRATWTAKFAAGIALFSDIDLGIDPDTVSYVAVFADANGKRGSSTKVIRRYPIIPSWEARFDVQILEPIITQQILLEMLEQAGMFIGIGQNRPQNRGTHGRFVVESVEYIGTVKPDPRSRTRPRMAA